jgi:hypothetical protein
MTYRSPSLQSERMLEWFFAQGVSAVDIHLRCPKRPDAVYSNADHWFWLTRHQNLSFDRACHLMKWCRHQNTNGADIYIRPYRHDKQPMLFLDDLNVHKAWKVARKYRAFVVQTSNDNTQVWMALTKALSEQERMSVQQYIASLGYTDPGSVSGEHFGRLCGLRSQKRNCWVTLLGESMTGRYAPPDRQPLSPPVGGACAKSREPGRSQSEKDFSWVLGELRRGTPVDSIIISLEMSARERGKPCPVKYAERTVRKAMTILK